MFSKHKQPCQNLQEINKINNKHYEFDTDFTKKREKVWSQVWPLYCKSCIYFITANFLKCTSVHFHTLWKSVWYLKLLDSFILSALTVVRYVVQKCRANMFSTYNCITTQCNTTWCSLVEAWTAAVEPKKGHGGKYCVISSCAMDILRLLWLIMHK